MRCPVCREQYAFFESKCTRCNVNLIDERDAADGNSSDRSEEAAHSDIKLVSVFVTGDPGVLPLAELALQGEGIEYIVRNAGKADSMSWAMSLPATIHPQVLELLVPADAAVRARDLLADLEDPAVVLKNADAPAVLGATESAQIRLDDAETGQAVGTITESQFQTLSSHLDEDAPHDYFISGPTLELLRDAHADADLLTVLGKALADRDGMVIRWSVR